jgi:hypothetical protein|tara:strand:+ start:629 stop:1144 length:516 start_codon:yes stop_codon:yes gene_type:complete
MGNSASSNSATPRRPSYRMREWSVRHARLLEIIYIGSQPVLRLLTLLWRAIGLRRVEKPLLVIENAIKARLFDCQTCGQCVLRQTGMSCPVNCPKSLRNGPCGGVRDNGACELDDEMPCVWVLAWQGSRRMRHGGGLMVRLRPLDHRRFGHSSWLDIDALPRQTMPDGRDR